MSNRYWIAASLLLWGACDTNTPIDNAPAGAEADADAKNAALAFVGGSGDTGPSPAGVMDWNTLTFSFQMGYDDTTGQAVSVFYDGGTGPIEIAPSMEMHLGDVSWNGDLGATHLYCTMLFPLDGSVGYDPPSQRRLLSAFAQDPGAPAVTDCFDGVPGDLDPYFGIDFHTYLQGYGEWGVAIGQTETYTETLIGPYLYAPLGPAQLVGGTMRMGAFFDPPAVDEVWGFGYELDGSLNVVTDAAFAPVAMPYTDIDVGGVLGSGWYNISSLFIYSFY